MVAAQDYSMSSGPWEFCCQGFYEVDFSLYKRMADPFYSCICLLAYIPTTFVGKADTTRISTKLVGTVCFDKSFGMRLPFINNCINLYGSFIASTLHSVYDK